MPISTVWVLKYVQQCYDKWFWTISSLGAPVWYKLDVSYAILNRHFQTCYVTVALDPFWKCTDVY